MRAEYLRNPFWKAVEEAKKKVTPDLPSTISRHQLAGAPSVEVMPEIAPVEGDYVITSKHRLTSFIDTDIESELRTLGIDTLILIGINTNTCVQCAAFEGFNRDYRVIVASDRVHSMYGEDLREFGLENVARCFGWAMSLDKSPGSSIVCSAQVRWGFRSSRPTQSVTPDHRASRDNGRRGGRNIDLLHRAVESA